MVSYLERVTKKESKPARNFADQLFRKMHKELNDKYRFAVRLVGSAKWNTILKDKDGFWDLDYQILLTKKSKMYRENGLSSSTDIKNDFFNYLNDMYKDDYDFTVENSTTAVTLINNKDKYSYDFVIIRVIPENNEIIRRNNHYQSSVNEFTWNELPKNNEAYQRFKELSPNEKKDVIENHILPRKEKEKEKDDNDPTKISSSRIFIEEVNNYVSRK